MLEWMNDPQAWVALVTLTVLEIVLGIDNIIFISILAGKLPAAQRDRARRLGLAAAMLTRIGLLLSISWLTRLTKPLFTLWIVGHPMSGRDLVLGIGGLFLIAKSVHEIHEKLEGDEGDVSSRVAASFSGVIVQIMLLDIVFSLDSVITAVGMAQHVEVMIAAVVLSVLFMLWFSGPVSVFVEKHPTIKMLALSFLILIGVNLVADGMGQHIPRGYVYFAMAFSVLVEMLNLRIRSKSPPVHLRSEVVADQPKAE
jgi:predicted tellurium resistance membrane protein TerC